MTRGDLLAAAGPSVDPGRWLGTFDELMTRAGARFSRVEPRRRARAFVLGLLAELPRKNCWTIAEHAGDRTPRRRAPPPLVTLATPPPAPRPDLPLPAANNPRPCNITIYGWSTRSSPSSRIP